VAISQSKVQVDTKQFFTVGQDLGIDLLVNRVHHALNEIQEGRPVLIIEDEIEKEGDVCIAAELATPQWIHFMAAECHGLICQPISREISQRLDLPLMVPNGCSPAFTITADAVITGSGVSAYDRATTARVIADPNSTSSSLRRPGHIFPIIARDGGVLERSGHTEASFDLVRMSGLIPSAVICEVMGENGHMAGLPELERFALRHNISIIYVRDLVEYRSKYETIYPFIS